MASKVVTKARAFSSCSLPDAAASSLGMTPATFVRSDPNVVTLTTRSMIWLRTAAASTLCTSILSKATRASCAEKGLTCANSWRARSGGSSMTAYELLRTRMPRHTALSCVSFLRNVAHRYTTRSELPMFTSRTIVACRPMSFDAASRSRSRSRGRAFFTLVSAMARAGGRTSASSTVLSTPKVPAGSNASVTFTYTTPPRSPRLCSTVVDLPAPRGPYTTRYALRLGLST
mmetsp:Transcript_17488/g.50775  ORF Transcript_17488/g.50775 Transcript_17488/m.50775 type:complete len:231 (+) Transcript_17488:205-897(+)